MALLEAMAMWKPVVATAVGGVPDIVTNGVNGIVLRERDPTQLAEALLALLADDVLAKGLAERGRRRVESEYSATRMAQRYESVYRQCLTSRADSHTVNL
jgi:glycosyltransferase involved in cell wall biosynthesis